MHVHLAFLLPLYTALVAALSHAALAQVPAPRTLNGKPPPSAPPLAVFKTCNDSCKIAAAKSYVLATVTAKQSDADKVPLVKNATRWESFNGSPLSETAKSGKELRQSLVTGPQSYTVISSQDEKYTVARNGSVVANYILNAGLLLPIKLAQAKVLETFEFDDIESDKIKKLVAYVHIGL